MKKVIDLIKSLFKKNNVTPLVFKGSYVKTYCGGKYDLSRMYSEFEGKQDIKITSVSITRVDHDGGRGYVDNYMIAVSFDTYK